MSAPALLIACPTCHRQYDVSGMKAGEQVRCGCGFLVKVPEARRREARMLHCSSCGGKLRDGKSLCEYCGSETTLEERNRGPACPECFARLPGGARFCPDCGVEIRPEALKTTRVGSHCPRCRGELVVRDLQRGQYTECSSCGGIWLDEKRFGEWVEKKDGESWGDLIPRSAQRKDLPPLPDEVRYLPCPTCGAMMNRKNFGGTSGVIIDWCKGHGLWFDHLELEKILDFVRTGGLERARDLDLAEKRRELERIEEKKRKAQTGTVFTTSSRHAGWDQSADGRVFIDLARGLAVFLGLLRGR